MGRRRKKAASHADAPPPPPPPVDVLQDDGDGGGASELSNLQKSLSEARVFSVGGVDVTITVTDWRVKQRPDDQAYKRSRELWIRLPRGCADAEIAIGADHKFHMQLRGIRKFGYAEDSGVWGFQYTNDPSSVASYQYATKENGECFHFTTSREMRVGSAPRVRFLFWGSKNCHMAAPLVISDDDSDGDGGGGGGNALRDVAVATAWIDTLDMYQAERYSFAKLLMKQFVRSWPRVQWDVLFPLAEVYTLCGEACDLSRSQHLVQYIQPELFFFAIIAIDDDGQVPSFTAMPPVESRRVLERTGLAVPQECVCVDPRDVERKREVEHHFVHAENCEGAVVYVVLHDGTVPCVYKLKNETYVKSRAVREQVRRQATNVMLERRLRRLHVPITDAEINDALRMNMWVQQGLRNGTLSPEGVDKRYMDAVSAYGTAVRNNDPSLSTLDEAEDEKRNDGHSTVVIMLAAPCPGSGKTRLAITLMEVLRAMDYKCVYVSQDDVHGKRAAYLRKLREVFNGEQYDFALLDKFNTQQNRYDYYSMQRDFQLRFVYVGLECDDLRALQRVCVDRILQLRGDHHRTLRASNTTRDQLRGVVASMCGKWQPLDDDEVAICDGAVSVDALEVDVKVQLVQVCHMLLDLHHIPREPTPHELAAAVASHRAYERAID